MGGWVSRWWWWGAADWRGEGGGQSESFEFGDEQHNNMLPWCWH